MALVFTCWRCFSSLWLDKGTFWWLGRARFALCFKCVLICCWSGECWEVPAPAPAIALCWQKSISAIALLVCLSKSLSHLYLAERVTFLLTSLITCNTANRDTGLCPLLFWRFAFLFVNTKSDTSHAVQTLENSRELKWRPYLRSLNSVLRITQKTDFFHCFSSGFPGIFSFAKHEDRF